MYDFAIVALLALAVIKVVDVVDGAVPAVAGYRSILTFVLSLGAVWVLDYSLFEGFGVNTRTQETGVILSGFMVAGMTVPWRAAFGWMTHDRAAADETLGEGHRMRAA